MVVFLEGIYLVGADVAGILSWSASRSQKPQIPSPESPFQKNWVSMAAKSWARSSGQRMALDMLQGPSAYHFRFDSEFGFRTRESADQDNSLDSHEKPQTSLLSITVG